MCVPKTGFRFPAPLTNPISPPEGNLCDLVGGESAKVPRRPGCPPVPRSNPMFAFGSDGSLPVALCRLAARLPLKYHLAR